MRLSLLSLLALGSLSALGIACSAAPAEDGDGSEDALETTNIGARHFGLEEGELVLTLDDGPAVIVDLANDGREPPIEIGDRVWFVAAPESCLVLPA